MHDLFSEAHSEIEYNPDADDEEYLPEEVPDKRRGPPHKKKKSGNKGNKRGRRAGPAAAANRTAKKATRTKRKMGSRSKTELPPRVQDLLGMFYCIFSVFVEVLAQLYSVCRGLVCLAKAAQKQAQVQSNTKVAGRIRV